MRAVAANRPLARVLAAYAGSAVVEWAVWVAVLVYAFERGGPTTAGVAAIVLMVPAILVAPVAGRAADGPRPGRVLAMVYALQAVSLLGTGVLAFLELPAWTVIVGAAVTITLVTFVRPAMSVSVPGLVRRPADLVSANLVTGNTDSASVLAGPLLAAALLALEGPGSVFAACGVLALASLLLSWAAVEPTAAVAPQPRVATRGGSARELVGVLRSLSREPGCLQVLLVLGGQYVLIGSLDLLQVNLAIDVLGLGGAGAGYLSAAFGVGALLGGFLAAVLVTRVRLAPIMVAALLVIAVAMAVLGAWTALVVTLVALPVAGISRSLLDVSGRILLQRSAPQEALASVFALLEVLAGLGLLIGSLLVQVLVAVADVRTAAVAVGIVFLVVTLACAAGLRRADARADAPVVELRLLRGVPLFAPLPPAELEALARASALVEYLAGDTIVETGEVGDRYYVIADGTVAVSIDGRVIREMSRGEGFGEIALLADIPRTATVRAVTPFAALTVDRQAFLSAVSGHSGARHAAWSAARTWHAPLAERDERDERDEVDEPV